MGYANGFPKTINRSYMRYLICALTLIPGLAACSPAFASSLSAPSFTADIGGMRITLEQPWYLYTHGEAGNKPERLFFTLMDAANGGTDIRGEGVVYEFPVAEDDLLPATERIRDMGPARLQKFVRELDRKYTRFDSAGTVALTEINGFTAIVREGWKKAAADPELQLTYYFPLRDRLVVLYAYVYGNADEAAVLKSICTSFIPDTSPAQVLNTVMGDGVSMSFPHSWSVVMNGFTGKKDTVWAVLEKRAGEEGKRLAKVSVLGPVASAATMFTSNMEQFFGDAEQAKPLVFHALGYRASLKNIKVIREETVTIAPGLQARLRAVSGEANGEHVELTFQDIPKDDRLLTVVTGTPLSLADEVRQELATIYASLKIEGDEPEITEHLDWRGKP